MSDTIRDCFKKHGLQDLQDIYEARIKEGKNETDVARELVLQHQKSLYTDLNKILEANKLPLQEYKEPTEPDLTEIEKKYAPKEADGSNPELVKAVEDLLGGEQAQTQAEPAQADVPPQVVQKNKSIADKIRSAKIDTKDITFEGTLGLPIATWNTAVEIVAKAVEAGVAAADAIKRGLNYIQKNHRGQWNKKQFNDTIVKELGLRGIRLNGEDVMVKPIEDKQTAEVINGWYSPLEQSILNTKAEKLTGKEWAAKLGGGKEMKWTGLQDFLTENANKPLTKKEVQQFLKDNRIEIVEVVKGGELEWTQEAADAFEKVGIDFTTATADEGEAVEKPFFYSLKTRQELEPQDFNKKQKEVYDRFIGGQTKFGQYQLEGQKENYKEVLVTLPSIQEFEIVKVGEPYQILNKKTGEYLKDSRGYIIQEYSRSDARNSLEKQKQVFKSSHFDEPNILVHLRMNTRTDADGKKVLFLEEIQSDWGQKGKKEGFKTSEREVELKRLQDEASKWGKKAEQLEDELDYQYRTKKQDQERRSDLRNRDAEFNRVAVEYQEAERKAFEARRAFDLFQVENRGEVPQAPFVTETPSWTKLGLKVALKEAVKQGADKIAWSAGEQQFDRWGSEEIHWQTISKPNGGSIVVKNTDKAPVIRGRKAINLASISKDLDPQKEIERVAEKWGLKPSDLEYKADIGGKWNISVNEQTDNAQAFAGNEEALRQNKLAESELTITSKEQLRESLERNLARERNKQEIDKLTDRIWDRMQKEESGTSMPRREGMKGFYDKIVPEQAKALVKELTGKEGVVEETKIESTNKTIKDYELDGVGDGFRMYEKSDYGTLKEVGVFKTREDAQKWINENNTTTQQSIQITPELKASVKAGMPLFKDRFKAVADALRKGKIDRDINMSGIPFLKQVWNGAIELAAVTVEKTGDLAKAIQEGIRYIKQSNWYKGLTADQQKRATAKFEEEFNKLVQPPPPPKETKEQETEGSGKKKSTLSRLYAAKNMPERAKEAFEKEGFEYIPASQEEAAAIAAATVDELGIDEAVKEAAAGRFNGGVNAMIFGEVLNRLADNESDAGKWAEVAIQWDKYNRVRGQDIAGINFFYKHSPLGVILKENADRKKQFDEWAKGKNQSWEDYFEELKKNPEFAKILDKKIQEDLRKERQSSRAKRLASVRGAFAKAKEKFRKEGGGTYAIIIPPHVIETVLEAMELAYEAGEAVVKIVDDAIKSISQKIGTDNWDKEKFRKEWESELSEKGGKAPLTDAEFKAKVIDKFRKKLKGLSESQKDEVIRKSYKKIIENGGLDYDEFKEIIGRVTGRGEMTDEQKAKLKEMVAKTNAAGEAAKVAQTERTPEALERFYAAEIEAGRAARDLRDIFRQKPDILRRLTSVMQLSTLGAVSLVANVTYNIWNQLALRFPIGVMNDTFDRVWGGIARMMGKPSTQDYNVWSTQGEFWNKMGQGLKESFEQIGTGLNRQDYTQKELYGQQMRPFKALRELYAYAKGKRPLTRAEWWDKLIEGTAGIPAELVARFLNVGDKPMRFAAAGAQAKAFSKALCLKDIDERLFIEFPQEEAYRYYKGQGLSDEAAQQRADYVAEAIKKEGARATLQQDNLLSDAITRAAAVLPGGKDSGVAALTKTLTISPYIKIPTNVFWSYYNLVNPEIGILQSLTYAAAAKRAKNKGDITKSKLLNREARYWMAHAILGIGLRAVVIAMVQAGRVTPPPDDEESKKERDAIFYFDKPGTIQVGDTKIQSKWFGHLGMLSNSIARKYYDATPEQRENQDEFWNIVFGGMEEDALKELENGVFANTSSLFQSLSTGDWSRYGINTLNLFANIIQPATIAQINRAALDEVPTSKGDSFLDRLNQNFAQRSTLYRRLFDVELYKKQDIFGRPIPKGGNLLSRMFGISKANPQLEMRPLYDDFLRTGDIGFFPPVVQNILDGKKLTPEQHYKLQEYIGQERQRVVAPYINDAAKLSLDDKTYSELSKEENGDELKKEYLSYLYSISREYGLEKFYKDYPDLKPKGKTIEEKIQDKKMEISKKIIKLKSKK